MKNSPKNNNRRIGILVIILLGIIVLLVAFQYFNVYEQPYPEPEASPTITQTPQPTTTPTSIPPTVTPVWGESSLEDWILVPGIDLAVSPYELELLARLISLECNLENLSVKVNCSLSVINTVVWRATQGYLCQDNTVRSCLEWGISPNRQQQFPNGVFECHPSATRCPDNIDLSSYREIVALYFDGAHGAYRGAHYGSRPDWPYTIKLGAEGQFIGWFNHWQTEFPTPGYCESQGETIPRGFALDWPLETREIIGWHNAYGHGNGVDFQGGDVVQVATHGQVLYGGHADDADTAQLHKAWYASYGNFAVIMHWTGIETDNLVTLYAHLEHPPFDLRPGDTIPQGTPIGIVGSTGNSIGDHLHFETWLMPTRRAGEPLLDWLETGEPMNPLAYLCNGDIK